MSEKIKIAISSCLLGEAVRYDGTDKHIKTITDLAAEYTLVSLCPEMAVGMGVPRPPIHLVDVNDEVQVLAIDDSSRNMTKLLSEYGREVAKEYKGVCGYIFKKNSPSCGTQKVKVLNTNGEYERRGVGIYAAEIIQTIPTLPVIDEEEFLNKKMMDEFLYNVFLYSKNKT